MTSPAPDDASDVTFDWLAAHVRELSRNRLARMGRFAGVTPFRSRGEWRFRDATGREVDLRAVFDALHRSARGREWLREEHDIPIRLRERAQHQRVEAERALRAAILDAFEFLESELGYAAPFPIPVRIDERLILAWRNTAAGRQVEVSGDCAGFRTHCEIRRFVDAEPGAYEVHSMGDWELRMVRESRGYMQPFDRAESLRDSARLLRRHPDILLGAAWIERDEIRRVEDDEWFLSRGSTPPPPDAPDLLDMVREEAAFLVRHHGFELEFDSNTLSPHESEMWRTLRYRRGERIVEIVNTDIRVPGEWAVRLDGRTLTHTSSERLPGMRQGLDELRRILEEGG